MASGSAGSAAWRTIVSRGTVERNAVRTATSDMAGSRAPRVWRSSRSQESADPRTTCTPAIPDSASDTSASASGAMTSTSPAWSAATAAPGSSMVDTTTRSTDGRCSPV